MSSSQTNPQVKYVGRPIDVEHKIILLLFSLYLMVIKVFLYILVVFLQSLSQLSEVK